MFQVHTFKESKLPFGKRRRREKASAGVVVSTVIPGAVRNTGNHTDRIWSQLKSRYNAASDELHTIYRLDEYMYFGMKQPSLGYVYYPFV